jgi:prepilin-type N-terminal cleavage/methylation domain-containing protein
MGLFEKRRKGFTLIELLIVIVVIITITGIAIPVSSKIIAERSLYNAAVQIQQDILLVQNFAITHSSGNTARFRIRFYPAQNKYIIEESEDANLVSGQGKLIKRKFPTSLGLPMFFSKNVPDSVVFGVSSVPPKAYVDLSFNNVGNPFQGGGHINLINKSGSKQIKVIVSLIGRVRIEWVKK